MTFEETVLQRKPKSLTKLTEGRFEAKLAVYDNGWRAVIKTVTDTDSRSGHSENKEKFLGLPMATFPYREVAFYELSKVLGWSDLVPETVLINIEGVAASAQKFVPSIHLRDIDPEILNKKNKEWKQHFRMLSRKFSKDSWKRLILMDLFACNRDRHGKNVIVKFPGPKIVAIDNSVMFGPAFTRYRCIFHKYLFPTSFNFIPYRTKLREVTRKDLDPLDNYLKPLEVDHVYKRIQFFLDFPYRLPYKVLAQGAMTSEDFPAYKSYFRVKGPSDREQLVLEPPPGKTGDPFTVRMLLSGAL